MQIHLDDAEMHYRIQAYEPHQVRINHQTYTQSLMVSSQAIWPDRYIPYDVQESEMAILMPFIDLKPQVFVFGTGNIQRFLQAWLQELFYRHNIGVEAMSTAAACRTYNLLLAEGRYVMASLLL